MQDLIKGEVRELLDRPWWWRTWTIQEAVLARKMVFIYGDDELPWNRFRDFLERGVMWTLPPPLKGSGSHCTSRRGTLTTCIAPSRITVRSGTHRRRDQASTCLPSCIASVRPRLQSCPTRSYPVAARHAGGARLYQPSGSSILLLGSEGNSGDRVARHLELQAGVVR